MLVREKHGIACVMTSGLKRTLKWLIMAAVGTYVGYLVILNGLFFTPLGHMVMNIDENSAQIRYSHAHTWRPFRVSLDGFQLRVQDGNMQLFVTADHVEADIIPWTMMTMKRFIGSNVTANGLTFWMRMKRDKKEIDGTTLARLPPIPGFGSVEREVPNSTLVVTDEAYADFGAQLTNMHITNLKQVWVEEYRYDGDIQIDGGFAYQPMRMLRLWENTTLKIAPGQVSLGSDTFATDFGGTIVTTFAETNMRKPSQEVFANWDADVTLEGDVTSVGFLNYYLKDVPQVRLAKGKGKLALKLGVTKGVLLDTSKLNLDTARLEVHVPFFVASGRGKIRWDLRGNKAWLDVAVLDLELREDGGKNPVLVGPTLKLLAQSTGRDLAKGFHLDVVLDLPEAKAKDLSFLNTFIPDRAGARIVAGAGTVAGNMELSTRTQHGRGVADVRTEKVVLASKGGAKMSAALKSHVQMVDFNMQTGALDLSGSHVVLEKGMVEVGTKKYTNYWFNISTAKFKLRPRTPSLDATIAVHVKNLQPILAVMGTFVAVPWAAKAFSNIADVRLTSNLDVDGNEMRIRDLTADSGMLHLRGDLDLRMGKKGQEPFGAMQVEFGELAAGIAMEGGKSEVKLFGVNAWFANQRQALKESDAKQAKK